VVVKTAPAHGVATFEVGGATWSLKFGINALCDLEFQVQDPEQVKRLMDGKAGAPPDFSTIRAGFWAALRTFHPEVTLEEAGRLIDALGMPRAGSLTAQALISAFPEADPDRPRKATRKRV
jgi:hypothetical protein